MTRKRAQLTTDHIPTVAAVRAPLPPLDTTRALDPDPVLARFRGMARRASDRTDQQATDRALDRTRDLRYAARFGAVDGAHDRYVPRPTAPVTAVQHDRHVRCYLSRAAILPAAGSVYHCDHAGAQCLGVCSCSCAACGETRGALGRWRTMLAHQREATSLVSEASEIVIDAATATVLRAQATAHLALADSAAQCPWCGRSHRLTATRTHDQCARHQRALDLAQARTDRAIRRHTVTGGGRLGARVGGTVTLPVACPGCVRCDPAWSALSGPSIRVEIAPDACGHRCSEHPNHPKHGKVHCVCACHEGGAPCAACIGAPGTVHTPRDPVALALARSLGKGHDSDSGAPSTRRNRRGGARRSQARQRRTAYAAALERGLGSDRP